MRLFIAIELPDEIKKYLKQLQKEIADEGIILSGQFHLTLKFLGEVSNEKSAEIKKLLAKVKLEPFKLKLDKIGVFPNENYIRVVWVDAVPYERVIAVQQDIDGALSCIFPKDNRFAVHITLARVKYIKDKKRFLEMITRIKVEKLEFSVEEFRLFKSTQTQHGRIYESIAVFKMRV